MRYRSRLNSRGLDGGKAADYTLAVVLSRRSARCHEPFGGVLEPPGFDPLAQLAHQAEVVVQVVHRIEPRAEDLVRFLQVVQVRAAEVAAAVAPAGFVERPRVVAPTRVADLDVARAGEEPAVARVARRQHAVEKV